MTTEEAKERKPTIEKIVEKYDDGEIRAIKTGNGLHISGPNMPEILVSRAQDYIGAPLDAIYRVAFHTKNNYPGYDVFLGPSGVIPVPRDDTFHSDDFHREDE